ncbi:uncharacterized protein LOC122953689 [Acropora millepora]|uniref:uncharacterized protein LOC122953689 n=1 Tax=Acropora millepora TaxID=45264 RepID=UPI001CF3A2EF|nr:uncharacterized protein LOC122953689 [Acropora millepora]
MPVTIKALKKENSGLRTQVEALMTQIKNLQTKVDGTIVSESSHASTPPCSSATEQSKSLEFLQITWLGLECDDLNNFRAFVLREISAIKSNLEKIADKVEEHSLAIEEIQTYSYRFNVKLLGVPELSTRETALQTTTLCVKIFNKICAEVSI